jgi:hypothetical protein
MRWFILASITALAACSGSGPVPLEEFCGRYAETLCHAAQRCDCLSDIEATYCPTFMASQCQDDVVTPVQSGQRAYDAAAAGHCLGGLSNILGDCAVDGDHYPDSCDTMLVGLIPEGQGCESGSECAPPLECHESACTAMPGAGKPCLQEIYCATDLFCADDGTCDSPRGRGAACPEGGEACGDDLYCDSTTTTCQPPLGVGDSCAADSWACGEGLYCSEATTTCTRYPGAGGDCAASSGECADGYYCDATETCAPLKESGAACTDDAECQSDDCTSGACASGTGTCEFM